MTSSKSVKSLKSNDLNISTPLHMTLSNGHSTSKSFSYDEEDERFYDAPDAVDNVYISPDKLKYSDDVLNYDDDTYDDDEDNKSIVFFDTATSRHASEISTNETKTSLNRTKSIVNEETLEKIEEKRVTDEVKNKDEDDDETDAELETAWSFWVDRCVRGTSKEDYEAGIKLIHTVKTVQNFWSVFNHIPDVSTLPKSYSYHLMRNNRRPLWEDQENCRGGQWKLKCRKEDTSLVWYELLLAGIGEQLSDCVSPLDDIVGLSVGCRDKEDIIQIWNLDQNHYAEATIFEHIQELVPNVKFSVKFYKPHNLHETFEAKNKNTLVQNNNHYSNHSNNYNHNNHNNSKSYGNKSK